ncbi:MAG: metalloregulator ArsR/SmtB family transcription factor [Chloroflexi bacterium]|nr:metalloregulator ArsR/SmtB family transcription factor [Chloroflexota bacterium]MDA1240685.1 metalloregulator ArsR/SmtB family transcription factor [Chloroflexota bacterium]
MDEVFRALGDPTRREVLRLLSERGAMSAGDLAEHFDLAKSTMSGHFSVLRQAGLIVSERQGTRVVYSATLSVLDEAVAAVMGMVGAGRAARSRSGRDGGAR